MSNLYNKDSIESLDPREFTRLKPNVYCGQTNFSTQLLVEIVSNAIDEIVLGHGTKIEITSKNGKTTCRDYGQGFLVNEFREDGKTILEASFSVLNTSGKYREDGVYEGTSLGNFGIGSKLQCYLSTESNVTTYRDGKYETVCFKDGIFQSRKTGKTTEPNGTYVEWYPDPQFFDSVDVEDSKIIPYLKTLTSLINGLKIDYNDKSFYSEHGLNDLVDNYVKNTELIKNRFVMNFTNEKDKLDLILTYTSNYNMNMIPYVNTGLTERGPHMTTIKTIITREFNKFFREKKWLKEKEDNLSGDDIQEGMYIVFNLTTSGVTYNAQVKTTVTKIDMTPFTQAIIENLQTWLVVNEKEVKLIADKALSARKAREAARKAREAARNQKEKKKKKVINPDKLKDAENLGQDSVLLCVEGLSAGASMAVARDTEHYGILALRGKPLNLLTNSKEKADKNEEIQLLITALGIDPNNYNSKDLRYGRVAIASDADSDGYHIGLLIAADLYQICPEFVKENRLCWLRSPLYIVKNGKKESYYYDDLEFEAARSRGEIKGEVTRAKGLGALSATQAHDSMFTDEFQRLDILEYNTEAIETLKNLMGSSVAKRKEFIFNNLDFSTVKE